MPGQRGSIFSEHLPLKYDAGHSHAPLLVHGGYAILFSSVVRSVGANVFVTILFMFACIHMCTGPR